MKVKRKVWPESTIWGSLSTWLANLAAQTETLFNVRADQLTDLTSTEIRSVKQEFYGLRSIKEQKLKDIIYPVKMVCRRLDLYT